MSDKDGEMVAVMLPRGVVDRCDFLPEDVSSGDERVVYHACKKALRPEPPSADILHNLHCGKTLSVAEDESLRAWIEYVLANGWTPDE